jgi:hypothetical protein
LGSENMKLRSEYETTVVKSLEADAARLRSMQKLVELRKAAAAAIPATLPVTKTTVVGGTAAGSQVRPSTT